MTDKIVMYASPEAAKFVTGISGWVDSKGRFWGDSEASARWSGCTHVLCNDCGTPVVKGYTRCRDCREARETERYAKLDVADWDGVSPVFSNTYDEYFFDKDHLLDFMEEYSETAESLRLVLCKEVRLSQVDEDFWYDELGDDQDLPEDVLTALENLNAVIRSQDAMTWEPTKTAVRLQTAPPETS